MFNINAYKMKQIKNRKFFFNIFYWVIIDNIFLKLLIKYNILLIYFIKIFIYYIITIIIFYISVKSIN